MPKINTSGPTVVISRVVRNEIRAHHILLRIPLPFLRYSSPHGSRDFWDPVSQAVFGADRHSANAVFTVRPGAKLFKPNQIKVLRLCRA